MKKKKKRRFFLTECGKQDSKLASLMLMLQTNRQTLSVCNWWGVDKAFGNGARLVMAKKVKPGPDPVNTNSLPSNIKHTG